MQNKYLLFTIIVSTLLVAIFTAANKPRKIVINTPDAPKAIGPYSQAIKYGNTLYLSGQIGLDPTTGVLVNGISAQSTRVFLNIGAVLKAGNATFDDVLACHVFLTDINDFKTVNEIYAQYFVRSPPARATVAIAKLPAEALVEIECTAAVYPEDN
jgi:2-iminobutanoate/2-iminopropanoate deaminase